MPLPKPAIPNEIHDLSQALCNWLHSQEVEPRTGQAALGYVLGMSAGLDGMTPRKLEELFEIIRATYKIGLIESMQGDHK